jgi:hypothetical protein
VIYIGDSQMVGCFVLVFKANVVLWFLENDYAGENIDIITCARARD